MLDCWKNKRDIGVNSTLINLRITAKKQKRILKILIMLTVLMVVVFLLSPAKSQVWQWQCGIKGNCIRMDPKTTGVQGFSTISECRLVCNPYSNLWPRPTGNVHLSRKTVHVDASHLTVDTSGVVGKEEKNFITGAAKILRDTLQSECPSKGTSPISVKVTTQEGLNSNWDTDESYSLKISSPCSKEDLNCDKGVEVEIHAATIFGARHGLESLGQLTTCSRQGKDLHLLMMSGANIDDKPAYPHRGLLIDPSRRYLSVETIRRTIRAMSWSKMNVLHLHISDTHSFPFNSTRVPQLNKFGAYGEDEIYSKETIRDLVEYARLRGVRILAEIDAPAHAGNGWDWDNQAMCVNVQPWRSSCIQPPCGQLNPTTEKLYSTLTLLYKDIWEAFQPWAFHMGGDEVFFPCWAESNDIKIWLEKHNMSQNEDGYLALWSYFQEKALASWDNGGSQVPVILWTSDLTKPELINKFLNKSRYVIQSWTEAADTDPKKLLDLGYKMIMSTKDAWYLDHGFHQNTVYHTWEVVYNNKILPASQGVYGGEVCMWGELVGDSNIDVKVWPRTSCAAERLWTNPTEVAEEALPRLQSHIEMLIRRGVSSDMVQPEWCSQNDGQCNRNI